MARAPLATPHRRIEALATLPLFHKLVGRKILLAGAGEGALWKAEMLLASGATVSLIAPDIGADFHALAADPPGGQLHFVERHWQPGDITGAALAICDFEEAAEAKAFFDAAHEAGVPVNVIDKPAFCDFQFGAIVNRSPLVVAISTDGAAPVFGQAIRARIEAVLPRGLAQWAQAARDWRPALQALALPFASRRRFWERFSAKALHAPERAPVEADRAALFDTLAAGTPPGCVILVGAGPGDPDLLTLKAVRALQSADIILYDDLVSAEVLELARREAKRMLVGKTGHGPSCKQQDINALMVSLARQGRRVVRLKSGDPMIFGRASEEIAACRAAGVAVEIVPGITSAQGAAASLQVSLTERELARRVQFVTGHGQDGALPADLNWDAIADAKATSVIYMPRKTLHDFAARAIAAGLSPETPALAIIAATRPDETQVAGTIATLPALLAATPCPGPVLVLVGAVLNQRQDPHVLAGENRRHDCA